MRILKNVRSARNRHFFRRFQQVLYFWIDRIYVHIIARIFKKLTNLFRSIKSLWLWNPWLELPLRFVQCISAFGWWWFEIIMFSISLFDDVLKYSSSTFELKSKLKLGLRYSFGFTSGAGGKSHKSNVAFGFVVWLESLFYNNSNTWNNFFWELFFKLKINKNGI